MFYEVNQNNSGGFFDVDDKVCHRLFIEADSRMDAISKAEELGCYWNGVDDGIDCECCGDRWYQPYDSEKFPKECKVTDYNSINKWNKRYGKYEVVEPPTLITNTMFKHYCGTIKFNSVEEWAQYLANEHGFTTPDTRIYYKDGTVKEIFKSK